MPEEVQPEVAPAVESGQGTEAPQGAPASEAPAPNYFDASEFADRVARVKVADEEIEVPVPELLAGYSRTADYTRKTQELAQQRESLQFADAIAQALAQDPAKTIEYLQQRYNIGGGQQEEEQEFLDPVEREVAELKAWRDMSLQEKADAQLQADIEQASALWDDVDPREAVAYAIQRGWEGRTAIHDAYAAIAGQRVLAERAAQRELAAKGAAGDAAALEAKRSANSIVEGGAGSANRVTQGPQQASSIREAWEMAKQQLGMS